MVGHESICKVACREDESVILPRKIPLNSFVLMLFLAYPATNETTENGAISTPVFLCSLARMLDAFRRVVSWKSAVSE